MVAPASRREQVTFRQLTHAIEERNCVEVDVGAAIDVGEVTDQAVTGDIGRRGRAGGDHRLRGQAVEGRHHRDRFTLQRRRAKPALDGRRHEA